MLFLTSKTPMLYETIASSPIRRVIIMIISVTKL